MRGGAKQMANCAVCGKGNHYGIKVSHSHRRSNRVWKSNVLAAKLTEHLENYMYVLPV